jgi:hypothetical protein
LYTSRASLPQSGQFANAGKFSSKPS